MKTEQEQMEQKMNLIVRFVKNNPGCSIGTLYEERKSLQKLGKVTVAHYLKALCDEGRLTKAGKTRGTVYDVKREKPAPKYRNREWLHHHYINEERTMADIAEETKVTPMSIQHWLDKHEIPTRPAGIGGAPRHRKMAPAGASPMLVVAVQDFLNGDITIKRLQTALDECVEVTA